MKVKYKVTMVCKEISRATVEVDEEELSEPISLEQIKDKAWSKFDNVHKADLEQENYTKVEAIS